MAEYVTKEQVLDWFRPYGHMDEPIPFETMVSDLRGMPAADVAPVRRGRWGRSGQLLECQCCGEVYSQLGGNAGKAWNFCPNCGADMRGSNDE